MQNAKDDPSESGNLQHYPILPGVLARGNPSRPQQQQTQQPAPFQRPPMIPPPQPPTPPNAPHRQLPMNQHMMPPREQPMPPQMVQPQTMMPQVPQPMQSAPAQPDSQPLPPQTAAERFRQVNRGLPDGVTFEPLDEETKAALQKLGMAPSQSPQTPSSPPSPPQTPPVPATPSSMPFPSGPIPPMPMTATPITPKPETSNIQETPAMSSPESAALLEQIIQDERNASIFYQHLSGISPSGEFQESLQGIARDCESHTTQLRQLLQKTHGRPFEPKNTPINTTVGFAQGVQMAVNEERKVLDTMAKLIDQLADSSDKYAVQNLLNKRMIRLNWLQWAMFQAK
ncbi:MAG: hypothetical protein FWD03_07335 [Defluviitaleaceae bacterium]|nr:hypothetical protein [Defluviitaleaceae bacterium]